MMEYDAGELPTMGTFRDAGGRVVLCVTFTRDDAGRVLGEEARMGEPSFLVGFAPDQELPDEVRADVTASALVAFPDDVFSAVSQTYDDAGRLIERTERFGALSEERTTYEYDDHGEVAEATSAGWRQSPNSDQGDAVVQAKRDVSEHHVRYEYQHDSHGNWTERVLFSRSGLDAPFNRSQIERRVITYYDR